MTTLDIQRRLGALGYDPGPADGIRGRLTTAAIRRFQSANGLAADGLAGPTTRAELCAARGGEPAADGGTAVGQPGATELQMRPWHAEALRLEGIVEGFGAADNPRILGWADDLELNYERDSIAWCGLFVGHCIAAALPDEPLPANPLGARNWLKFGSSCAPTLGAVLVFWRGERSGWQGHVGFYAGEDAAAFHVLGGNQSDSVSVARIARKRLLGARWPKTAPPAEPLTIARGAGGEISRNEA